MIVHSCFKHAKGFLKHHQFASRFEQWNFISNGTLKKIKIDNPIIMFLLWLFKNKIIVLSIIHMLCDSFYFVCSHQFYFFRILALWLCKIWLQNNYLHFLLQFLETFPKKTSSTCLQIGLWNFFLNLFFFLAFNWFPFSSCFLLFWVYL